MKDFLVALLVLLLSNTVHGVSKANKELLLPYLDKRWTGLANIFGANGGLRGDDDSIDAPCENGGVKDASGEFCICLEGFRGVTCEITPSLNPISPSVEACTNNCNSNGRCVDGKCFCSFQYGGDDCSITCLQGCGNGYCSKGVCVCRVGYYGEKCENKLCPGETEECNGRGVCNSEVGKCECDTSFGGKACSYVVSEFCDPGCTSPRGECVLSEGIDSVKGTCHCEKGWEGVGCEKDRRCPAGGEGCSGHGSCEMEICICDVGWLGDTCEKLGCPNNCSSNGKCIQETSTCDCVEGFFGLDCSIVYNCDGGCGDHSICVADGLCGCVKGFEGEGCVKIK